MMKGEIYMKLLKIENKKCYISKDGVDFKPISDIAKEDIYEILQKIYDEEEIVLDEYIEGVEIASDVEKLIYSNIYGQLKTFVQNKPVLVQEINSEMQEVIDKYKDIAAEE